MIERLKSEAALWKREESPHDARWLSPSEGDEKATTRWSRVKP